MRRVGLIGTKIGNSSVFGTDGSSTQVTVLRVDDCIVSNIKTKEKDGYNAIQIASIETGKDIKKVNKPQRKIFSSLNINPKKVLKEFRIDDKNFLDVGTSLNVSHFKKDQYIDVTSTSIGKGFAGVMKRHNFGGLRASHGVSISHRSHGSTGQRQDPGKVFKGKKMAGHMGDRLRTMQNIEIIKTDLENELLYLKGSIPGSKNAEILVKKSVKNTKKMTITEKMKAAEEAKKTPEKKKK